MSEDKKYEVKVMLQSLSYTIEAENEDEAINIAIDLCYEEKLPNILKWAEYEAEEVGE